MSAELRSHGVRAGGARAFEPQLEGGKLLGLGLEHRPGALRERGELLGLRAAHIAHPPRRGVELLDEGVEAHVAHRVGLGA